MRLLTLAMCVFTGSLATSAIAKDFFLTIGGGPRPDNNQVSLERNVMFQQGVLAERRPDHPTYELYFADGNTQRRDLQYRDPHFDATCPPARRILAEVLGDASSMDLLYRSHELENLTGPSDPQILRRRLRDLAKELKPGDRLILYATAHGGRARKAPEKERGAEKETDSEKDQASEKGRASDARAFNTTLYCWGSTTVTASELAQWLDELDPEVTVMLVMVQCFAGGFAHTIFHAADADQGLAAHARLGFFAQIHDRPAAGCTPDIEEPEYQEYSSFFWAALAGHTRSGTPITAADYDNDGAVSFAEAHAYAVLTSDTVDVPVRTTDALLRTFSVNGHEDSDKKPIPDDGSPSKLIKFAGPLASILERARPEERAILVGLSERLSLENPTIESLQANVEEHEKAIKKAAGRMARARFTTRRAKALVQKDIAAIWPELERPYAPLAVELVTEQGDEFVRRVEDLGSYTAFQEARTREATLDTEHLDLERKKAKVERLLRTAENVVLAANLPSVASAEITARYEKLRSLEESTLAPRPFTP